MATIMELREKRAKLWEGAKAFLDSHQDKEGKLSAEDAAAYDKMEADVVALGKDIECMERQAAIDAELAKPTAEGTHHHTSLTFDGHPKGRFLKLKFPCLTISIPQFRQE